MKKSLLGAIGALALASPAFAGSHVIRAQSTQAITFYSCPSFSLIANGDGDTDLDFVLYDPAGRPIRSDFDGTDLMVETIGYGRCGTYRLEVENLGSVYNELDVQIERDR